MLAKYQGVLLLPDPSRPRFFVFPAIFRARGVSKSKQRSWGLAKMESGSSKVESGTSKVAGPGLIPASPGLVSAGPGLVRKASGPVREASRPT